MSLRPHPDSLNDDVLIFFELEKTIDSGHKPARTPSPRKSDRFGLNAEVILRRAGQNNYRVRIYDVSPHGCKIEFVERPKLDELVWVKFKDLEALEAFVCWVKGFAAGVEFQRPIHPAVFQMLLDRLSTCQRP